MAIDLLNITSIIYPFNIEYVPQEVVTVTDEAGTIIGFRCRLDGELTIKRWKIFSPGEKIAQEYPEEESAYIPAITVCVQDLQGPTPSYVTENV